MESGKYYVIGFGNNLYEGMTKEQVIAAIVEATGKTPTDIDDAFITKIKELNKGRPLMFWVGTEAEYNALPAPEENVFYIFSDANDLEDIIKAAEDAAEAKANEIIAVLQSDISDLQTNKQNIALSGSTDPDNSQGVDGDIYFKYEA